MTDKKKPAYINVSGKKVQYISGLTYVDGQPANGTFYELFPGSKDTSCIIEYEEGKENGTLRTFYPNGRSKELHYFVKGWKEGTHKGWFASGKQAYIYHFKNDEFDGSLKEWTESGILFRDMNYEKGYEKGPQKIYYADGKIKSNYVIKNGIRYGLLGTKNCKNVSDSAFVKR